MSSLGAIITQAIVHHYGRDEFLQRLSHPFWFQSFGAVMGMDWHSSGITTSVIGALKRGLAPLSDELGIHVCGGRGQHSRKTPDELRALGDRIGFDGARLTRASRLVAKVDSAAVQDGFDLYLHGFFVTDDGKWTVVQQGMNGDRKQARRYHWHSEDLKSFVGGKDRHPYPVPLKVYDETIRVMKSAVLKAKLGREEEMQAFRRLDSQARRLEATAEGPSFQSFVAAERTASPALDGRSVFGWEKDLSAKKIAGS
jgi:hypothetical protein